MKKMWRYLNSKALYYAVMFSGLFLLFFALGENGYLMWSDSPAYLACDGRTGIMPLYPLLIKGNQLLFKESLYLYAIVVAQAILSIACIVIFTEFVRKQFELSYLASYPVWLFSAFMPFTVNLPQSVSSHDIKTEAIAYPLFYLYMICFLKAIWDKQYKWIIITMLMSSCLALTRTQLQLCVVLSAAALFYVMWIRIVIQKKGLKRIGCFVICVCICGMSAGIGEGIILMSNSVGQRMISVINAWEEQKTVQSVDLDVKTELSVEEVKTEEIKAVEEIKNDTAKESVNDNVTKQYGHLVIDKAIWEIDEDDYLLFEDIEKQKFCREIFAVADEQKSRYAYIRNDLWKWEDIMNNIAGGTAVLGEAWTRYLSKNPDTYLESSVGNEIAWGLLIEHIGRVFLHTLQMMPQGFVCTVFFQKAEFYGLCHLIALFVYLSALWMVIWGYRNKELPNKYPEFMLGCIVVNVLFVLILCVMFFAMQRYLVYCFGIFYVAYYLIGVKYVGYLGRKIYGKSRVCDTKLY